MVLSEDWRYTWWKVFSVRLHQVSSYGAHRITSDTGSINGDTCPQITIQLPKWEPFSNKLLSGEKQNGKRMYRTILVEQV